MAKNRLYYGDNLSILRGEKLEPQDRILDESVDLVYLDPPFNSQQDYNVLFQERTGSRSATRASYPHYEYGTNMGQKRIL